MVQNLGQKWHKSVIFGHFEIFIFENLVILGDYRPKFGGLLRRPGAGRAQILDGMRLNGAFLLD